MQSPGVCNRIEVRKKYHVMTGSRSLAVARFVVAVALLLTIAAPEAAAQINQAFEEYGVGPRDAAMGNAYTAVADDFAAAFYNPAGLSQPEGFHFTAGYKFLSPRVTAKMDGFAPDEFTDYPTTHWGMIGLTTDLQIPKIINPKYTAPFAFGTAIAICNFLHSYTNYYDDRTPYYYRYQDRPVALLSAYFGMSARIANWVSIGGGLVLAPSITNIDARVRTDVYLPEGSFESNQGTVNRAKSIIDPVLGVLFRIPIAGVEDRLRVGLVWKDEVRVIDGNGVAQNRTILHTPNTDQEWSPVPTQVVPVQTLTGYSPMQATLGLAARPYTGALISADTIWKRWSVWKTYFYNEPDPPFADTIQQRIGFEQRFLTQSAAWLEYWALRAGWYYEPSPAPSQDNEWNLLDNDKHVTTTGFGLRLDRVLGVIKTPINLDANFQAHWLESETIENDKDDAFPKITTGGQVYSGTVALELAW